MRLNRLSNAIRFILNVRGDIQAFSSRATLKLMMNIAYENWLSYISEYCHIPESLWGADGLVMAKPRYGKSFPYLKGVEHGFYVPPYSQWGEYC